MEVKDDWNLPFARYLRIKPDINQLMLAPVTMECTNDQIGKVISAFVYNDKIFVTLDIVNKRAIKMILKRELTIVGPHLDIKFNVFSNNASYEIISISLFHPFSINHKIGGSFSFRCPWSPELNSCFPDSFKKLVKTLILSLGRRMPDEIKMEIIKTYSLLIQMDARIPCI